MTSCEDVAVPEAARICSVCRRRRAHGSQDRSRNVFICVACESDAKLFIAIQESIRDAADKDGGPAELSSDS